MSEIIWDTVAPIAVPFIGKEEGFRAEPYLDSVKIPTIGYGTIKYPDGKRVTMEDEPVTQEKALEYLNEHVKKEVWDQVKGSCPELNVNQYAALVSLVYNIGFPAFSKSTLLKRLNEGDFVGAAFEFLRWNRAGGKVLKGLMSRREREKDLFQKPVS